MSSDLLAAVASVFSLDTSYLSLLLKQCLKQFRIAASEKQVLSFSTMHLCFLKVFLVSLAVTELFLVALFA